MSHSGSNGDQTARPSLVSEYAGDAEMADLIDFFLDELGDGVEAIGDALQRGNLIELRRVAGQISSAAGGYGFPILSQIAGELEMMLKAAQPSMTEVTEKVATLTQLCLRATAGIRAPG